MASLPSHKNTNQFQTCSVKYQNITNRLERLKHSQNQSPITRSSSQGHNQQRALKNNYSSNRILMDPSSVSKQDQSALDIGNKYAGRVTKNTGIKKYNQRQIRQILNTRKYSPQNSYEKQLQIQQEKPIKLLQKVSNERAKHNILIQQNKTDTCEAEKYFKLIPGKIYTRQQLQRYYDYLP